MVEFGLEDLVGRTFEKLAPRLQEIAWKLFALEGSIDRGILTLEDFLGFKNQLARLRIAIEDLPVLVSDPKALMGGDVGAGVAS